MPSTRSLASVARGNSWCTAVPPQTSSARAAICADASERSIRIGRARTSPASARASDATSSSSATGRSTGSSSRYSSSGVISCGEVEHLGVRGLLEQVVAADEVLRALVAERRDDLLTSSPIDVKKRAQFSAAPSTACGVNFFRPCSCASSVVSIWVAMPTWHVSSWQPRQIVQPSETIASVPNADPVGAHAEQLHDVVGVAVAAVGPDLDPVADPGLHQRLVHQAGADVRGQADVAERVLARGAGPALEARRG